MLRLHCLKLLAKSRSQKYSSVPNPAGKISRALRTSKRSSLVLGTANFESVSKTKSSDCLTQKREVWKIRRYSSSSSDEESPITWSAAQVESWLRHTFRDHAGLDLFASLGYSGSQLCAISRSNDNAGLPTIADLIDVHQIPDPLVRAVCGAFWSLQANHEKIQPFYEVTEEAIKENVRTIFKEVKETMDKSNSLTFQQTLQPLLQNPLPLKTGDNFVDSYFSNDLLGTKNFQSFVGHVENSTASSITQEKFLVNLVQVSGSGKTHYAMQYAQEYGGLVIRFVRGAHDRFLTTAKTVLEHAYETDLLIYNTVSTYEKELEWLDYGKQVLELIPLTFIEYAKYFYEQATDLPTNSQKHTAFQRATMKGSDLILNLFKQNLTKRFPLKKPGVHAQYANYKKEILETAKSLGIKAFFYDEIHQLQELLKGLWIHYAKSNTSDVIKVCLDRLKKERVDHVTDKDDHYLKPTSLLYLQVLVMEDLCKDEGIAQIGITTKYSATTLSSKDTSGPRYSRDRLQVEDFVLQQPASAAKARFLKLTTKAFGKQLQLAFRAYDKELGDLSSRALYLFPHITNLMDAERTYEKLAKKFIKEAKEYATRQSSSYLESALSHRNYRLTIKPTLLYIALGGKRMELDATVMEHLVDAGIAKLQTPVDKPILSKVERIMDPFMIEAIQAVPISNLIKDFAEQLSITQLTKNQGQIGEFASALMLKNFALANQPLAELNDKINLSGTIASWVVLNSWLIVKQREELDMTADYEFFTKRHPDIYFVPKTQFGPDGIAELKVDGAKVGYLLVHCKNWESCLNIEGVEAALKPINPNNFYSDLNGRSKAKKEWKEILSKIAKCQKWIRLIFAGGFTDQAVKAVADYNKTKTGMRYPIILTTPLNLPEKIYLTKDVQPITIEKQEEKQFDDRELKRKFGLQF